MNISGKRIVKVLTLTVIGATVLAALYIMANGLGLQDSLDFGAGHITTPTSRSSTSSPKAHIMQPDSRFGSMWSCSSPGER